MNIDVKGVHLEISQNVHDYLNKKLKRLGYAKDLIVDLLFTLSQDSKEYKAEVNINFRWGTSAHIGVNAYNLIKGIDDTGCIEDAIGMDRPNITFIIKRAGIDQDKIIDIKVHHHPSDRTNISCKLRFHQHHMKTRNPLSPIHQQIIIN